jgi:hypothetical protein
MIVSFSNGREVSTDNTSTCNPLILVTAFKGLSTLKALNEDRLNPPPLWYLACIIASS